MFELTLTKAKATAGGSSAASMPWDSPPGIVPTALIFEVLRVLWELLVVILCLMLLLKEAEKEDDA